MRNRHTFLLFVIVAFSSKIYCALKNTDTDVENILDMFDTDHDGVISIREFKGGMSDDDMGEDSENDSEVFFERSDVDRNGILSVQELLFAFYDEGFASHEEPKFQNAKASGPRSIQYHSNPNFPSAPIGSETHPYFLYDVIKSGNYSKLEEQLPRFYSPDASAQEGQCTPLHVALMQFDFWNHHAHLSDADPPREYERMALLLIEKGADLRHVCEGRTALHLAVQCRSSAAVEAILDR